MSANRKLNRRPLVAAWNRWMKDTPSTFNPETLGPINYCHRYLENRLAAAFDAGWYARAARKAKP